MRALAGACARAFVRAGGRACGHAGGRAGSIADVYLRHDQCLPRFAASDRHRLYSSTDKHQERIRCNSEQICRQYLVNEGCLGMPAARVAMARCHRRGSSSVTGQVQADEAAGGLQSSTHVSEVEDGPARALRDRQHLHAGSVNESGI
jgi:hypothetical protein